MIYDSYTNRIKKIVAEHRSGSVLEKSFSNFGGSLQDTARAMNKAMAEQKAFRDNVQIEIKPLAKILGITPNETPELGVHPDFKHLVGTDNTEHHYIVSVFIDIDGSTNLNRDYSPEDIYRITNTIQSAAIHTVLALGGHVQRLQGDGVFAYFGGRNIDKKIACDMAILASSMFTYFVENDLRDMFNEDGIEDINTRIGIDFGDEDDVLWANFGTHPISELTTVSLHTSLASKMQQWAKKNGIVVGQNVRDRANAQQQFYDLVRDSYGEVKKRYIFENRKKNFYYTQYKFDWYLFLKSLPFIKVGNDGKLSIKEDSDPNSDRLARLRATTALITDNQAYVSREGQITKDNTGVQNQPHRFHYE